MMRESVDYSVIVNDDMVGQIILGRELQQEDPLSLYLFIITVHKNSGAMGFKNHTTFNLAMLGKQEWKHQFNPSSLVVSRLFKARYFPIAIFCVINWS
jgi:hypothetical protein